MADQAGISGCAHDDAVVEQTRVLVLQQPIHLLHELDVLQLVVLEHHSLLALGSHGGQLVPGGVSRDLGRWELKNLVHRSSLASVVVRLAPSENGTRACENLARATLP
eukprot:4230381-Pleurochrysis_carterae.AAC.1